MLWPTPVDRAGGDTLRRLLDILYEHGVPSSVSYGTIEFLANIVMFVPFGLFWFILAPSGWRWTGPLAGMGLSILIELTQLVVLPQRLATPADVLANTLGTMCGTLSAWVLISARNRRRSQEPHR